MIQGTGSGVGKSIITAALCRIFKEEGLRVAPFKAQNMALNSFVTIEGHEMGRAQAYQAEACGLAPDVRMNPVLLKPSADNLSQVIVMGKPWGNRNAASYYKDSQVYWEVVKQAYQSLASEYDVIVIEGAGSPAEINLQDREIVNMRMAAYANAPVLIVADIDRGGVFAWIKGTYDLVAEIHRCRIKGFIINKFRGDKKLLDPGIDSFERLVPVKVLGVIPFFKTIQVDEEDSMFYRTSSEPVACEFVTIGIVPMPRLSNFTDFAPLFYEPDVRILVASNPEDMEQCDCIILPGSKSTISDALALEKRGWFATIRSLYERGRFVAGICGGFQMMGSSVHDPNQLEGLQKSVAGIGILPVETTMEQTKVLKQVSLTLRKSEIFDVPCKIYGYEIHMGTTMITDLSFPLFENDDGSAGIFKGHAMGTYVHGFFDEDRARRAFINFLRKQKGYVAIEQGFVYRAFRDEQFSKLSTLVRQNCNLEEIYRIMGMEGRKQVFEYPPL